MGDPKKPEPPPLTDEELDEEIERMKRRHRGEDEDDQPDEDS